MLEPKQILNEAEELMESAVMYLDDALAHIRAGKASGRILDPVKVEYYGQMSPIANVATVTTPDARTIQIQPWEKKMLPDIERAIINSNINADLVAHAKAELEKLDAKNEKRKNTQTKTQKENETIKVAIVDFIKENGASVASVIANGCGISTQKASALCKLLVEEKTLTVADIKVKNKGTLKQYALAVTEEVAEEVADTESDSE